MNKISIAIGVVALLMYGCSDKPKNQDKNTSKEKNQSFAKTEATAAPQTIYGASAQQEQTKVPSNTNIQNTSHIANVLETMNGGGYTYVKVDEKGNVYWIAGPQSNIAVGDSISFLEQMVMTDFNSKALKKKFDKLVFVSTIVSTNKSVQNTMPDITSDKNANYAHGEELTPKSAPTPIKITKNSTGYSVEEIYAKKADLKDKNIKVNAKVVKVSKNIMKKDWIHLQDGSGANGTNDIIATAINSTVKVGDIVTAQGIIKTNIDLGYGYKYPVIIEEAKFTSIK